MAVISPLFQRRTAGVLLHPTSLPCSESCWGENNKKAFGTLGKDAYYFIDLIAQAGLTIWQMLPTGPTQADMSPYQSISAHAGNPDLISLDWLLEKGWIRAGDVQLVGENSLAYARQQGAGSFYEYLETPEGAETRQVFQTFCSQQ